MAAEPKHVLTDPWDVNRRLAELGIPSEILTKAVEASQAARAACTENDAPNFPGIAAWNGGVRSLREDLSLEGWQRLNDTGQPLIVRPDNALALTVTSADENTGRKGEFDPKTNSCKGPRTLEKVALNGWLFLDMAEEEAAKLEAINKRRMNTWMLLVHYDKVLGQVRSELSRPVAADQDGIIVGWSERIILPPFDVEPEFVALPDEESGPDGGEIDIDIKRRA
jgi:hypothetical protein